MDSEDEDMLGMDVDQRESGEFESRRHHRSKEDAIYGSFLDDMPPHLRGKPPPQSRNGNGRAGEPRKKMVFVAGGEKEGVVPEGEVELDNPSDEASDDEVVRRLGLGGESGKEAAGAPTRQAAAPPPRPPAQRTADPFAKAAKPSTANTDGAGGGAAPSAPTDRPAYSSFTASSGTQSVDKEFAKWDTSGKMAKMMAKMGFKPGQGLGKYNHGVASHIEVKLRGKGLGLQDSGERTKQSKRDFPSERANKEEKFQEQLAQWKAPAKSKRATRAKYNFKPAEEFVSQDQPGPDFSNVKVVDMTGPTARVTHGYGQIKPQDHLPVLSGQDGKVPMPELQHNINMLVEDAATEVHDLNAKVRKEVESRAALESERTTVRARVTEEGRHITRLEQLVGLLGEVKKAQGERGLALVDAEVLFARLQGEFPREYSAYSLGALAPAVVFPLIRRALEGWSPLSAPKQHLALIKKWRALLETGGEGARYTGNALDSGAMSDYERLCWTVVVPHFRQAFGFQWPPKRACIEGVELVEAWAPVLPPWITQNIAEQLVAPRILSTVEDWQPRTDPIMVHTWIHPWLPLLGKRIEPAYPLIRRKLAQCLKAWDPADGSARQMIDPWRQVFSNKDMQLFLVCHISPRLAKGLEGLRVNPANQVLDPIRHTLAWRDVMPLSETVKLFEQHVWPKFIKKLCEWLSRDDPNYNDIADWYLEWKKQVFGDRELMGTATFQAQCRIALEFMERAVSGSSVDHRHHERKRARGEAKQSKGHKSGMPPTLRTTPTSTRDLVERLAESNGILFVPRPGVTEQGKRVYAFGDRLHIYFDQDVVFGRKKGDPSYLPMSHDELAKLR